MSLYAISMWAHCQHQVAFLLFSDTDNTSVTSEYKTHSDSPASAAFSDGPSTTNENSCSSILSAESATEADNIQQVNMQHSSRITVK